MNKQIDHLQIALEEKSDNSNILPQIEDEKTPEDRKSMFHPLKQYSYPSLKLVFDSKKGDVCRFSSIRDHDKLVQIYVDSYEHMKETFRQNAENTIKMAKEQLGVEEFFWNAELTQEKCE